MREKEEEAIVSLLNVAADDGFRENLKYSNSCPAASNLFRNNILFKRSKSTSWVFQSISVLLQQSMEVASYKFNFHMKAKPVFEGI